MGHLIPVVVLASRPPQRQSHRASSHSCRLPAGAKHLNLHLHQNLFKTIELPPVDISHLIDPSTQVITQLCLMVREALPFIRSAITDLYPDALIVDHFNTEKLPIAAEFNLPKFLYIPSMTWFTALTVYRPVLDLQIQGQYVDQQEPLKIPGCTLVRPEDVVDPMLDRSDQQYDE